MVPLRQLLRVYSSSALTITSVPSENRTTAQALSAPTWIEVKRTRG
jgi:hypothetical protein